MANYLSARKKLMRPIWYGLAAVLAASVFPGCTVLLNPGSATRPEARSDFSDPVLNQRRVFLVGHITEATGAEAIRQLLFLDAQNDQPIDLYLMTPGGDLNVAFAVVHTMGLMRSRVNTCALGECNSAGAVLLAAGTGLRQAFPDSIVVIHGMEANRHPPAQYVELTQASYTAFWRCRARLPGSWLPIPQGKLLFLTAQQALDYGVIDRIVARPAGAEPAAAPNGGPVAPLSSSGASGDRHR